MRTNQPTTSQQGIELSGTTISPTILSPFEILTDIICAEPEFNLLRETLALYREEIGARS